ncbi:MAG: hypothetical protein U9Q72_02935 [Patescibacteria group bacterium]|nr:hypothetical protein [Patescibacteria group bacterium]
MENKTGSILETIKSKWQFIGIVILIVASLTFAVSAIIPPTYSSEVRLLILQKNLNVDSYRAAKSSEYAGAVIKEVIQSANFMQGVLGSKHSIEDNFGNDPKERLKKWNKTIIAGKATGAGIVSIEVLHKDFTENKAIMNAAVEKLLFDGKHYHGNDNIFLKNISGPVFSEKPEYPKVFLNTLIGGVVGLLLALGIILSLGDKADSWIYTNNKGKSNRTKKDKAEDPFELPMFYEMASRDNESENNKRIGEVIKEVEEPENDSTEPWPEEPKDEFAENSFPTEKNFSFKTNFISDERGPGLEENEEENNDKKEVLL